MSKLVLDPALRAKLNNLDSDVEVCDESGNTIGYFLSAEWHHELLYTWAKAQVTDEELEEARRQTGGRPLEDILKDLEKL
jgi:hypothetical protein